MKRINERGQSGIGSVVGTLIVMSVIGLVIWGLSKTDTRHKAKVMTTKKHHIVMQDDRGKWYEYTLNNTDVFIDVGRNSRGEFVLPRGGSWVNTKPLEEEEDEATAEEDTTVDEAVAEDGTSAPDGAGDVGGDAGGASDGGSSGDSGGDGGGDGGSD